MSIIISTARTSRVFCWKAESAEKGWRVCLNDDMKPRMYGDMEEFAKKLRKMGYREVRIIDTAQEAFGSHRRATLMMLGNSRMIVGQK